MNPAIFHLHLDICERCRKNPFNLCPTGQLKMQEALKAKEATKEAVKRER